MRLKAVARASLVSMVLFVATANAARAQTALPGSDKVAAEALFEDARKLVGEGKYAEACPKFADSERLDPSASTLLNLASCWEKAGKSATAWATYREAESAAQAARRPDYRLAAQRHADSLAPRLARLTISVQQPVAGMQLRRDGVAVGSAEWGVAIPIDSGAHAIAASAPGYKDWSIRVDVANDGTQLATAVPAFEPLPVEPLSAATPAPSTSVALSSAAPAAPPELRDVVPATSSQGTVGLVVAGFGIVGLGVSGVLAGIANGKKNDSLGNCEKGNANFCSSAGVSQRNDALALGDAATVALAIGAAALATGFVVWLSAPSPATPRSASAGRVGVSPSLGGAVVQGTW
jgi:hypothetical protein